MANKGVDLHQVEQDLTKGAKAWALFHFIDAIFVLIRRVER